MNIFFLIFHGLSQVSGISKKIQHQIKGLKENGHHVVLCHYEVLDNGHRVRMIDQELLEDYGCSRLAPIRKRMCFQAILDYIQKHDIQLVYIRSFHNSNPFTIHLCTSIQKAGTRIVMEIPTYPYDQEYKYLPLSWKINLAIDKCFRKRLARSLDAIVTFSDASVIFGQKTIQISNGIDFESIPLRSPQPQADFHLIAVAEIHFWHGYDRMIEGLGLYYQTAPRRKVYLHLVGGIGEAETVRFQFLIQKYHIEDYVIFYGQLENKDLNPIFDQANFAIGSLGRHRSGIDKIKTLKNREYAARGISFIYSETDDDFEKMPYILKTSPDDTPVCVPQILDFYDSLTLSPLEIRRSIQSLSWKTQMQKVIDQTFTS